MTSLEKKSIAILASLMSLRMLGLFMILPVLSLFAANLENSNARWIGMVVGIYGFTQAIFQIIFGALSDRFGRKPITSLGLLLLAGGSLLASMSHSIFTLIIARGLQGMGAIGSTILAWLSDLTSIEHRTKAMAILGAVIGSSFALSLVLGSFLNSFFGPSSIFICTALLSVIAIGFIYQLPDPYLKEKNPTFNFSFRNLSLIFKDPALNYFYLSTFLLHTILSITFMALPFILYRTIAISAQQGVYFYMAIILTAFATIFPLINQAERKKKQLIYFGYSILLITLTEYVLSYFPLNIYILFIGMALFFISFSFLEAQLPALTSKLASEKLKGTTLSFYSTSQFLGVFAGGVLGGLFLKESTAQHILLMNGILGSLWLIPHYKKAYVIQQKLL